MTPILAIDPGSSQSAFVIWDGAKIIEKAILPNMELLRTLPDWRRWGAERLVIEHVVGQGRAGKEVTDAACWEGRFIERWGGHYDQVARHKVKSHFGIKPGQKGNADARIRKALIGRLGEPGTKRRPGPTFGVVKDLWAALAVAVYWVDIRGM